MVFSGKVQVENSTCNFFFKNLIQNSNRICQVTQRNSHVTHSLRKKTATSSKGTG